MFPKILLTNSNYTRNKKQNKVLGFFPQPNLPSYEYEPERHHHAFNATTIAIVGWAVAHWLSSRREMEQKRCKFRGVYSHFFVKCAAGIVRGTIPPALR